MNVDEEKNDDVHDGRLGRKYEETISTGDLPWVEQWRQALCETFRYPYLNILGGFCCSCCFPYLVFPTFFPIVFLATSPRCDSLVFFSAH